MIFKIISKISNELNNTKCNYIECVFKKCKLKEGKVVPVLKQLSTIP
jgi:hypothetical protein